MEKNSKNDKDNFVDADVVFCLNAKEQDMATVADRILKSALSVGSHFVLMFGDLGAGKTHLAREVVFNLTGDNVVPSPTFSIVNHYFVSDEFAIDEAGFGVNFSEVNHFDLYRINGIDELESLGFLDMVSGESLNIIEWPEIALPMLSGLGCVTAVYIESISFDERDIASLTDENDLLETKNGRRITCKIFKDAASL